MTPDPDEPRSIGAHANPAADTAPVIPAEQIPDDERVTGAPIADKGAGASGMAAGVQPPPSDTDEDPVDAAGYATSDAQEDLDELEFSSGSMDDAGVTQGDSVVDAEYEDRGPADHLDNTRPGSQSPAR